MGEYEYITKGICDVPTENDSITFNPSDDDMAEKIEEAKVTGKKLIIATDRIAHFWNFFERNKDKQYLILYGGSGGGKSHSVDQYLVHNLFTVKDIKIAAFRKSGTSLTASIVEMIMDIISKEGYREGIDYIYNRTNRIITAKQTNSSLSFKSLDNPEKIKSTRFSIVYIEEGTEFTLKDFMLLQNTLRKESTSGFINKMIVTWNPTSNSWCWDYFMQMANDPEERKKYAFNHSTYKNNPHLPHSYVEKLEQSYKVDYDFFMCYCLGQRGKSKNNILNNWNEISPADYNKYVDKLYGVDFGYNNPTAIVEMYQSAEDKTQIYAKEILFQSRMTTGDVIDFLNESHPEIKKRGYTLVCDSAEPDRIAELNRAGYVAIPADKSVRAGINKMIQYRLNITRDSENLLREVKQYQWSSDKDGNITDIPRKIDDHCCDALRYAIMHSSIVESSLSIEDYIREDDVFYI